MGLRIIKDTGENVTHHFNEMLYKIPFVIHSLSTSVRGLPQIEYLNQYAKPYLSDGGDLALKMGLPKTKIAFQTMYVAITKLEIAKVKQLNVKQVEELTALLNEIFVTLYAELPAS